METSLNVYDYPDPPEEKMTTRNIKIYLTIMTYDDFNEKWSDEDIKKYIADNLWEYIQNGNTQIEDIEL